jgi:hypothetical protein
MVLPFLSSFCAASLISDLKAVCEFFTSFEGRMTILCGAFLLKVILRLLRSTLVEARELGVALGVLTVTLALIVVPGSHVAPSPKTYMACFPENYKIAIPARSGTLKVSKR